MDIQQLSIMWKGVPGLLRSAPAWAIALALVLVVVFVASAGPLVGRAILISRRREMGQVYAGNGVFWDGKRWDETNAGTAAPEQPALAPDDVQVIRDDRLTIALEHRLEYLPPASEWATGLTEMPEWAKGGTSPLDVLVYVDAEMVEAETEAERQFHADPLGSWVLPPEVEEEYDFLPTADEAVSFLISQDLLTGEGLGLDAEWEAWNLYEREEISA